MRFLAFLSFLGLMAFIGFSSISRADGWEEQPIEECERYDDCDDFEEEEVQECGRQQCYRDRDVVIENNIIIQQRGGYRGPIATVPQVYPQVPIYRGHYGRPLCVIRPAGGGWFDLWMGNRFIQRGVYGVVRNSAWYYLRLGHCGKGFQ